MADVPIVSTGGFPSSTNVVKGLKCMQCCEAAHAKGRVKVLFEVFRLLGDLLVSLNDSVNYLNEKRTILNYSEVPTIGLVRTPEQSAAIPIEQYRIRAIPDVNALPRGQVLVTGLALPFVLVGYYQYIEIFERQIEILTAFQEALNKIPPSFPPTIGTAQMPQFSSDCIDCCKGGLLSQEHPRKIVTEKIRKRL